MTRVVVEGFEAIGECIADDVVMGDNFWKFQIIIRRKVRCDSFGNEKPHAT
jgi:hypothetical protein